MAKAKIIMIGTRTAGTAINLHFVMVIGNGVVKSNNTIMLKENGRSLQVMEDWARGVLKSINLVRRKGATGI